MSTSLHGKAVLITREKHQAKEFTEKVLQHGGNPIEVPLLNVSCKDYEANREIFHTLHSYQWLFFTSANGVKCFFQLAKKYQIDTDILKKKQFAVVGHKTGNVLKRFGFTADFIPSTYNADVMASEFLKNSRKIGPVLLVRGNRSRDVLPIEFMMHGLSFHSLEVYETTYNFKMADRLNEVLSKEQFDFITFTSPSTVEAFTEMAVKSEKRVCVCIGTTTEIRARELGFTAIITPKEFTIDGMILCMSDYIALKGR